MRGPNLSTVIFVTWIVIGFWANQEAEQRKQAQATQEQNKQLRDDCLSESALLRVPVREQLESEMLFDYWNYSNSVNSAEGNARQACFDQYGYEN